jgi:hypothetical protein
VRVGSREIHTVYKASKHAELGSREVFLLEKQQRVGYVLIASV